MKPLFILFYCLLIVGCSYHLLPTIKKGNYPIIDSNCETFENRIILGTRPFPKGKNLISLAIDDKKSNYFFIYEDKIEGGKVYKMSYVYNIKSNSIKKTSLIFIKKNEEVPEKLLLNTYLSINVAHKQNSICINGREAIIAFDNTITYIRLDKPYTKILRQTCSNSSYYTPIHLVKTNKIYWVKRNSHLETGGRMYWTTHLVTTDLDGSNEQEVHIPWEQVKE